MANMNDYKNVKARAKKYSKFLNLTSEQFERNGARFGFYLMVLECVTNEKELNELSNMIIDTDFRNIVYSDNNDDLGVDAVYINVEKKIIQLFNFKYRDNFNPNRGQKIGDLVDVSRFLLTIQNENLERVSDTTKKYIEEIISHLNSDDLWEIELYMVSNDNISMKLDDHTITNFIDTYSLNVHSITLKEIIPYITDFPKDLNAKFIISSTSVMTYEIDELSSSKSYLIKLSLAELIKITCSDVNIRINNMLDYSNLRDKNLDTSLLFDNVRGYLGETTFNKNIIKTIQEEPNKFFMYNNGLTITAKNIKAGYINGNKRFQCEINGFQIVNGGQTLRSIYKFCNEHFDEEKLASAEILVRLFQTESDETLTNNIAEYTNSQNAISLMDLKSVNNFQIQIEAFLKSNDIHYVRKNGDMGDKDIDYEKRISMKRVSQIIYSSLGFPDRSINQTKALFGKYYDEIFSEDILSFDDLLKLINMHFEIVERYKESIYTGFEGKFLYVIYLKKLAPQKSLIECIELLEKFIVDYKSEDSISVARKLIQKGFKDYVEEKVSTEIQ